MFLGSSYGLAPVGFKKLVFIPGKSVHCLDLEPFFLVFNKGSWELNACHRLIGGLNGALSESAFSRTLSHRLTSAVWL